MPHISIYYIYLIISLSIILCSGLPAHKIFNGKFGSKLKLSSSINNNNIVNFIKGQTISYGAGTFGLIVLLGNRLSILIDEVSDIQSRVDLISVMACSALLLNALTKQEIETRERDAVALVGYSCRDTLLAVNLDNKLGFYLYFIFVSVLFENITDIF